MKVRPLPSTKVFQYRNLLGLWSPTHERYIRSDCSTWLPPGKTLAQNFLTGYGVVMCENVCRSSFKVSDRAFHASAPRHSAKTA